MPCAEACPAQGIIVYGKPPTVAEALKVAQEDAMFYARSGGGMTISGGEPLLQSEFALNLLRLARERRVKTCIETCGLVPTDVVREAAQYLNYVLFDIKHMDPEVHKKHTGMPNDLILKNFQTLVTEFPNLPITARTPVIPGFNDHGPDIKAICDFLKPFEHVKYEMLPYHRLGTQKYTFLDRVPPMGDVTLDDKSLPPCRRSPSPRWGTASSSPVRPGFRATVKGPSFGDGPFCLLCLLKERIWSTGTNSSLPSSIPFPTVFSFPTPWAPPVCEPDVCRSGGGCLPGPAGQERARPGQRRLFSTWP